LQAKIEEAANALSVALGSTKPSLSAVVEKEVMGTPAVQQVTHAVATTQVAPVAQRLVK
jgi:hypothetical protein